MLCLLSFCLADFFDPEDEVCSPETSVRCHRGTRSYSPKDEGPDPSNSLFCFVNADANVDECLVLLVPILCNVHAVCGAGIAYSVLLWLDDGEVGVRVPLESRIVSSLHRGRLWSPPSLINNGYRGLFPRK
jgi:hypothetical protein